MLSICGADGSCDNSGDSFGDSEGFDGDGVGMNVPDEDNYPYN
jgi:hypothetical protein